MATAHLGTSLIATRSTRIALIADANAIFALTMTTAVERTNFFLAVNTSKTRLTEASAVNTHTLARAALRAGHITTIYTIEAFRTVTKHLGLHTPAIAAARLAVRAFNAHRDATVFTLMRHITLAHTLLTNAVAAALVFASALKARNARISIVAFTVLPHRSVGTDSVSGTDLATMLRTGGNTT